MVNKTRAYNFNNSSAVRANEATERYLLDSNPMFKLGDCSFYTAVYENKADKAIKR